MLNNRTRSLRTSTRALMPTDNSERTASLTRRGLPALVSAVVSNWTLHRIRSLHTFTRTLMPTDNIEHTASSTRRRWPALVSEVVSNYMKPLLISSLALLTILLNGINVYNVSLRHMNVSLFKCSIYLYFKLHVVMCIIKYFFYLDIQSSN